MKLKVTKERAKKILERLKTSSIITVEIMKGEDEAMVNFYVMMIKKGKCTIEKVPAYLRDKVQAILDSEKEKEK